VFRERREIEGIKELLDPKGLRETKDTKDMACKAPKELRAGRVFKVPMVAHKVPKGPPAIKDRKERKAIKDSKVLMGGHKGLKEPREAPAPLGQLELLALKAQRDTKEFKVPQAIKDLRDLLGLKAKSAPLELEHGILRLFQPLPLEQMLISLPFLVHFMWLTHLEQVAESNQHTIKLQ
jgi:hypothetical protein